MRAHHRAKTIAALGIVGGMTIQASAVEVVVTITNHSKPRGIYLTPVWVGFHDGEFDLFNPGVPAAPGGGLERVAEDGDLSVLRAEFAASDSGVAGGADGIVFAPAGFPGLPVFDPQETASALFEVDPAAGRYFSFVSMIIPSNDAFIGNADPMRFELFDEKGDFLGPRRIKIMGSMVYDAGTEENTEMDAAFFNQFAGNTGVTTADPVALHPGYVGSVGNPPGTPTILGGTSIMPPGIFFSSTRADFTRPRYTLAEIVITLADDPKAAQTEDEE